MSENKSLFDNYTKEQLQQIINESNSIREVILKVGLCGNGMGSYSTFYRKVKFLQLDISKLKERTIIKNREQLKKSLSIHRIIDINDILIENSNFSRVQLKKRLIKNGILENKCSICGQLPIWNNLPLTLQLDHINGVNNDNRINNLRILCPHCHSQQLTTGSKKLKLKKNIHISRREYKEKLDIKLRENQENNIMKVKNSGIDFTKRGWVKSVSLLIGKRHQKINKWMKKNLPEIYINARKKGDKIVIEKKYKYPKINEEICENIRKLFMDGYSRREISNLLNIGRNRINKIIEHTVVV